MSLKDNFNQAIKDLLKKDLIINDEPPKNPVRKTEMDSFMGGVVPHEINESLAPDPQASEDNYGTDYSSAQTRNPSADDFRQAVHNQPASADPFGEPDSQDTPPVHQEESSYNRFEYSQVNDNYAAQTPPPPPPPVQTSRPVSGYGGGYNPPPRNPASSVFRGGRPPETPYYETEETTIISRNTRISGDISSFANVNVEGSVQGDIKLTKNISVSGKVVGNIECNNAVMAGAQMQGSISSKGQVQMDHDSVLLGNIDTQYLDLNGRIKGNVDVGGKAEFKNDAVIVGDITASTISVIDGAVIKGYVNTTFMQESTSNVFPEAISVGEM